MNMKLVRLFASATAALLLLSWGQNSEAQTTTPPATKPTKTVNSPAAGGLLTQAYSALAADHDYNGNRVRAMKQIEIAAKILGVTLAGDGKVKEAQATSDQQLHTAQTLLQQALAAGLRPKPQEHIEKALAFLNTALSIK